MYTQTHTYIYDLLMITMILIKLTNAYFMMIWFNNLNICPIDLISHLLISLTCLLDLCRNVFTVSHKLNYITETIK